MKKRVKRVLVTLLAMTLISMSSTSATYAIESWVQKSSHWVDYNKKTSKSCANGYITAKRYHYANVWLYVESSAKPLAKSGRKWGYNKVTAKTKWVKRNSFLGAMFDFSKIFYGC